MGVGYVARLSVSGGVEVRAMLENLGNELPTVGKEAVQSAADIIADEIRKNLEKNLAGSKYSTGDLADSFGIAPVDIDDKGVINTVIGFHGYDSKGVANVLKARAMESGSSKQQAKPFFRPAVNSTRKPARTEMEKVVRSKIKTITKE